MGFFSKKRRKARQAKRKARRAERRSSGGLGERLKGAANKVGRLASNPIVKAVTMTTPIGAVVEGAGMVADLATKKGRGRLKEKVAIAKQAVSGDVKGAFQRGLGYHFGGGMAEAEKAGGSLGEIAQGFGGLGGQGKTDTPVVSLGLKALRQSGGAGSSAPGNASGAGATQTGRQAGAGSRGGAQAGGEGMGFDFSKLSSGFGRVAQNVQRVSGVINALGGTQTHAPLQAQRARMAPAQSSPVQVDSRTPRVSHPSQRAQGRGLGLGINWSEYDQTTEKIRGRS